MDVTLEQYTSEMDGQTNNTRHEIIDLLESIQRVVNEHDDRLDRGRSTTLETLQRHVATLRGESERTVDNMMEVMLEMSNGQMPQERPQRVQEPGSSSQGIQMQ
eukprot:1099890-Karenia_brevis.AAC.1